MTRALLALSLVMWGAAPARAQTADVYYRSWRWMEEPAAGRAAGLAGASTALVDDAAAAEANPAALTTLTKNELTGSLLHRGAGTSALGDSLAARTGFGFGALAGRLNPRWAVGAFVSEPQAVRIDLASPIGGDGLRDEGHLDGVVVQRGIAAAFRVNPKLHVGVRVSANHLDLDGEYRRLAAADAPRLLVQARGDSTRVATRVGVLLEMTRRLRLGLVRESGARWPVQRTASSPLLQETLDPGSEEELRQPSVVSGGLLFRASPKLLFSGQLDYVRHGVLRPADVVRPGGYAPSSYELFAWEARLGMEVSLPLPSLSVQLRAGLHTLGRGALRELAATFDGATSPTAAPPPLLPPAPAPADPELALRAELLQQITALREPPPPASPESPLLALGASIVTAKGVRFDLAARLRGERSALLFATAVRF
ncbi:MAG TPA: UPF0164 family protein [Vicinamibacteria bacterium]